MKLKNWLMIFFGFAVCLGISIGYYIQKWWPNDYNVIVIILWSFIMITIFICRDKLKKIQDLLDK